MKIKGCCSDVIERQDMNGSVGGRENGALGMESRSWFAVKDTITMKRCCEWDMRSARSGSSKRSTETTTSL